MIEILRVSKYNGKSRVKDPMDDSLVPIIPYEKLDEVATAFLREHYPAALRIPMRGQEPVWVGPIELAQSMRLTVKKQRVREDGSVFGQIHFDDTDTEMYDANANADVPTLIKGRTIVVDPQIYLLRNLGSFNIPSFMSAFIGQSIVKPSNWNSYSIRVPLTLVVRLSAMQIPAYP